MYSARSGSGTTCEEAMDHAWPIGTSTGNDELIPSGLFSQQAQQRKELLLCVWIPRGFAEALIKQQVQGSGFAEWHEATLRCGGEGGEDEQPNWGLQTGSAAS